MKVYTDGSCVYIGAKRNGRARGESGWGAVFTIDDVVFLEAGAYLGTSTSNRAEMIAAIQAIHIAGEYAKQMQLPFYLYTDNCYLQTGMTEWINQWRERDWQTVDGNPVLNRDLWEILDKLSTLYQVHWRWVQGHGTCEGNNRADEIARAFRAKNPPVLFDDGRLSPKVPFLPLASMDDESSSSAVVEPAPEHGDDLFSKPVSGGRVLPLPWNWVQILESSGGKRMADSELTNRLKFREEAQARWQRLIRSSLNAPPAHSVV